jgi:Transposase DDE domain group 1
MIRGRVFADLAVVVADGRECVSDLAVLRGQPALFGDVASVSTARRVMLSIGDRERAGIRRARAAARARAWKAGAAPDRVVLEFDATQVTAHSEKELAAGHYKGGFGFHPLLVTCGRETLAAILRPGNAGANNADDHLKVLDLALEQLPKQALDGVILARADSAGASHDFAAPCRECDIQFSLGYGINVPTRAAILDLPESAWVPAVNADGEPRDGAWVAELTPHLKLAEWPTGTRLICRRERPHPGAQLSFTDHDGHRFQCFITDQISRDLAFLEADHRQRAQVEDRVKTLKATGGDMLPFHSFQANAAWLELALTATGIMIWTQALTLDGEHQSREPKRLRYRVLHLAGQTHAPRPHHHPAPARRLAMGQRDHPRLRAPRRPPRTRLTTAHQPRLTRRDNRGPTRADARPKPALRRGLQMRGGWLATQTHIGGSVCLDHAEERPSARLVIIPLMDGTLGSAPRRVGTGGGLRTRRSPSGESSRVRRSK